MSRAIFFDLDGTLTDSGPGIINCAQLALAHFGIQVPDRDQLRVFVGPPLRQSFARFGVPPASLDEAIARFRARYVPIGKFENTPYPGIAGLLDRLQGAGYRLFVATSKPQVTAQEVLEHFQLARYFERVCGASLDAGRETKEDVISYLLAQIGDPGQVVMVGDTCYIVTIIHSFYALLQYSLRFFFFFCSSSLKILKEILPPSNDPLPIIYIPLFSYCFQQF